MEQLAEATLGEMQKEMVNLASIMTKPEKQGRGYGTALGKIVTDIVRLGFGPGISPEAC